MGDLVTRKSNSSTPTPPWLYVICEPFGIIRTAFKAIFGGTATVGDWAVVALPGLLAYGRHLGQKWPPGPKFEKVAQTSLFAYKIATCTFFCCENDSKLVFGVGWPIW